jgi:hypothetical protein
MGAHAPVRMINARQRLLAAGAIGIVISALLIWIPARGNPYNATFGDAELYRYVATHLTISRSQAGGVYSVRFGRIVFPVLLWLLSGGREAAIFYIQPIIMMFTGGVIAAESAALLPGPFIVGLVPFASLALSVSIMGGFAEPLVVAFVLGAILLVRRKRWGLAALLFAFALLTKEVAITVIAGVILWQLSRREYKSLVLGVALLPYLAWSVFVQHRYGYYPWSDPWWNSHAFGAPFLVWWRTLSIGGVGTVVAAVHAVLAISMLLLCRRYQMATVAAVSGLQVFVTVRQDWMYLVDGLRGVVMLEVFWLLAVVMIIQSRDSPAKAHSGRSYPLVGLAE